MQDKKRFQLVSFFFLSFFVIKKMSDAFAARVTEFDADEDLENSSPVYGLDTAPDMSLEDAAAHVQSVRSVPLCALRAKTARGAAARNVQHYQQDGMRLQHFTRLQNI